MLANYKGKVDKATKFIPSWVKVAVALALGLGTMVGWKRIVVTVGEKIGKEHLTYAQGASAELVAMCDDFCRGQFWVASKYHARAEFGRGGDHGGQPERAAIVDHPEHCGGLGVYAAGGGAAVGNTILAVPASGEIGPAGERFSGGLHPSVQGVRRRVGELH